MVPDRILVTGAGGFVGRYLQEALRNSFMDCDLICTGHIGDTNVQPLDVTKRDAVAQLLRDVRPDVVFHLAGIASPAVARNDPDLAWRVNLHGTLAVARALLAEAPNCRLFFVSSSEVYGRSFAGGVPVSEKTRLDPATVYASTKAAADLTLGAMVSEGLRVVRLRPFNHTGPGQSPQYVLASFAEQAARISLGLQPPVIHVGSLESRRDFLDVRDVCAAYVQAIRHAECLPEDGILNVASGTARRIGDMLSDLLRIAGVNPTIQSESGRLRPNEIPVASGDASLIRSLTGWRPVIPWEDTLKSMVESFKRKAQLDS